MKVGGGGEPVFLDFTCVSAVCPERPMQLCPWQRLLGDVRDTFLTGLCGGAAAVREPLALSVMALETALVSGL